MSHPSCLGMGGRPGLSTLGRDNCKEVLQQGKCVSLWQKVMGRLAKLLGDVAAATGVRGRSVKEVFAGGKGFRVADAVAKHMVVMV